MSLEVTDAEEFKGQINKLFNDLEPSLHKRLRSQTIMREIFKSLGEKLQAVKFDEKVKVHLEEYSVGNSLYATYLIWKCGIFIIKQECEEDGKKPFTVYDEILERSSFSDLQLAFYAIPKLLEAIEDTLE